MMASSATSQKWEKKQYSWPPWTLKKPENGMGSDALTATLKINGA